MSETRGRSGARFAGGEVTADELFWRLAAELQADDARIVEGTIMNGRCLRVGKEFLALVDYKGSGLVVKLPMARVAKLIESGVGQPFAPAERVFKEWLSVPKPTRGGGWRSSVRVSPSSEVDRIAPQVSKPGTPARHQGARGRSGRPFKIEEKETHVQEQVPSSTPK